MLDFQTLDPIWTSKCHPRIGSTRSAHSRCNLGTRRRNFRKTSFSSRCLLRQSRTAEPTWLDRQVAKLCLHRSNKWQNRAISKPNTQTYKNSFTIDIKKKATNHWRPSVCNYSFSWSWALFEPARAALVVTPREANAAAFLPAFRSAIWSRCLHRTDVVVSSGKVATLSPLGFIAITPIYALEYRDLDPWQFSGQAFYWVEFTSCTWCQGQNDSYQCYNAWARHFVCLEILLLFLWNS